jgi:hypothetical protein
MIMTTFVQWLHAQEHRTDPVGWFSKTWMGIEGKPRLSSPARIGTWLEENGYFSEDAGAQLRDAYDATLAEYRKIRAMSAASEAGGVTPLPGMPEPAVPPAERAKPENAYTGWPQALLTQMCRDLELIKAALGIDADGEGQPVRVLPPGDDEPIGWQRIWDDADHEQLAL